jgi:endoribonuclease Dicer
MSPTQYILIYINTVYYLMQRCGPIIGMRVMSWFGIMPVKMLNSLNLLDNPYPSPRQKFSSDPSTLLPMADSVEETLGYKFADRAFLLQAFTHPSSDQSITDCYQRIEFLGDAIIGL